MLKLGTWGRPGARVPGWGRGGGGAVRPGGGEGREGEGCRGRPPTWPAAVTVLLWPPGRPAGACPPGPSGPTPPRGGSRRSRLRFRSGTGAGRSRQPPSRRRPAGCPGRYSSRPRRPGNSGGGRGQHATPASPAGQAPYAARPETPPRPSAAPHLRQPVHVARACGHLHGNTRLRRACAGPAPQARDPPTPPRAPPRPRPLPRPGRWASEAEGPKGDRCRWPGIPTI